jgi:DUF1365 family protein
MTAIATAAPVADRNAVVHAPVALYEGTVRHRRFGPVPRSFTPKLFLAYVDVDALPGALDSLPFWSARRAAPVHFRREDFFDGGTQPLGDAVRDLVESRLGRRPTGSIFLLAHLRTFGWLANPLAVYYCWNRDGDGLEAIVLEVTNTPWGERQWYVFDARHGRTSATTPKAMHVSPFLPMDVEYRVTWTDPRAALRLRIQVTRGGSPVFEADLALRRSPLDRRNAIRVLARRPFMPFRVSAGIYQQALRLFIRRAPLYRHPRRPQRSG